MDVDTRTYYEQNLQEPNLIPVLGDVMSFLNNRAQALAAIPIRNERKFNGTPDRRFVKTYVGQLEMICQLCDKTNHKFMDCTKFKKMHIKQKYKLLKEKECDNKNIFEKVKQEPTIVTHCLGLP